MGKDAVLAFASAALISSGLWGIFGSAARHSAGPVVTGHVLDVSGTTIRVAHNDIPGVMPAMTMAFTLADVENPTIRPGDEVRFVMRTDATGLRAADVRVTGRKPIPDGRGDERVVRVKKSDAVPPFALVDENGVALTDQYFRGHATVMTFIFTRCPVPEFCPVMVSRFKQLQGAIERDPALASTAQLLAVTLDPEFDTPEVLRAYGQAVGAQPVRWKFAGGLAEDVRRVSRAFSVHVEKNGALLDHTLTTVLIGTDGRIIEIWRGNGWTAEEVLTALRAHGRP